MTWGLPKLMLKWEKIVNIHKSFPGVEFSEISEVDFESKVS